ncbi:MAG: tRNA-intron lyase [Halolamina sp.]|uniref:tRNA-intron lyase n=1 Tax=Halolamina sp. TaxID=1940283 RepID=UPI002FC31DFE
MNGTLRDGVVHLSGNARQQFYDSGGYGRPAGGSDLVLAPVEAAHLLYRGDLDAVRDEDGTSLRFRSLLTRTDAVRAFVVYKDLRDRGFYLSPAREGWIDHPDTADLVVYPRGKGPADDEIAYRLHVVGERSPLPATTIDGHVLAVVDEDGELTYFGTEWLSPSGTADPTLPEELDATLMEDRMLVWNPPETLYETGFFGQRLAGRNADSGPLQLSLLEAAYLADCDVIEMSAAEIGTHAEQVEGERFTRRYVAYKALREAGTVPKSGFKFGADFRVYEQFDGVESLGHSDKLIRVAQPDHEFLPRELSLDVRLAGGVRKRMVFALTAHSGEIEWLCVERITP